MLKCIKDSILLIAWFYCFLHRIILVENTLRLLVSSKKAYSASPCQVGPIKFTSLAVGNASEEYLLTWVAKSAYNVSLFHLVVTSRDSGTVLTELEVLPGEHSGTWLA